MSLRTSNSYLFFHFVRMCGCSEAALQACAGRRSECTVSCSTFVAQLPHLFALCVIAAAFSTLFQRLVSIVCRCFNFFHQYTSHLSRKATKAVSLISSSLHWWTKGKLFCGRSTRLVTTATDFERYGLSHLQAISFSQTTWTPPKRPWTHSI
jgi:hypothetical protein